ncbi:MULTISPECIES: ACT domain-containing protein [unclassified Clostridium]|uniref:ACT domain-containing protein n=1 Tax=unclassified Clostridium TaxID=2614128 RepID=UPI002911C4B6|nr:ACT domain-containing protein [Clostridium sp.]MDU5105517.1 ACT domain-containing protein [Clostridium sp.]
MKGNFLIVDKRALPDVYEKVIDAKRLLKEGKVKDVTEAAKTVNISRSVYYKYKEMVFDLAETDQGQKVTINLIINDNKGVLSEILNYISEEGGNIITINQGIPMNKKANVSLTINISSINGDLTTLMEGLSKIKDVEKVDFIAME